MTALTKRELAQKRNWFKFQLTGRFYPVDKRILTEEENDIHKQMKELQVLLLNNFSNNSKKLGLNPKTP
jgi:hypothetical protein